LPIPESLAEVPIVIGYTGIPSSTREMVEGVAARMSSESFRLSMDEVSNLALSSIDLLKTGNPSLIGDEMIRCHDLLREIGVSSPELDNLIDAVLPFSYGAKLTGAGGGGCIIALAKDPLACATAINEAGGIAFTTSFAQQGVQLTNT
jgi:mevalonate kinase